MIVNSRAAGYTPQNPQKERALEIALETPVSHRSAFSITTIFSWFIFAGLLLVSTVYPQRAGAEENKPPLQNIRIPLAFEPNLGQAENGQVRFLAHSRSRAKKSVFNARRAPFCRARARPAMHCVFISTRQRQPTHWENRRPAVSLTITRATIAANGFWQEFRWFPVCAIRGFIPVLTQFSMATETNWNMTLRSKPDGSS